MSISGMPDQRVEQTGKTDAQHIQGSIAHVSRILTGRFGLTRACLSREGSLRSGCLVAVGYAWKQTTAGMRCIFPTLIVKG
jgi:hypothetical protein